jgi:hypothetical protein
LIRDPEPEDQYQPFNMHSNRYPITGMISHTIRPARNIMPAVPNRS